jgi:MFS family permease
VTSARRLLSSAPAFRQLFLATFASGIGTWLAVIALTIDVYDRTGSGRWVSALLVADFLPMIVIGLTLGPLVDRLPRRALLIGADLARLAVFCALPFAHSAGAIVGLAAAAGVASAFFRPAVYAGLPNLVGEDELPRANALFQTAERLTVTLGPLAGGLIVAGSGPTLAYAINAGSFAVSAALLTRIPAGRLQQGRAPSRGHWRDLGAGFALLRTSQPLAAVVVVWSLVVLGHGFVNVAEVALAKVTFSAGDVGFGLLFAGFGVGLAAGSFGAAGVLARYGVGRVYPGVVALQAVGVGAAAAAPSVWVAIPLVALFGLGNGVAVVANALLVQRGAPDALRGRAFTLAMSVNFAALGAGMIAAGPVLDALGARWCWAVAAALCGTAAAVAAGLLPRVERGLLVPAARPGELQRPRKTVDPG